MMWRKPEKVQTKILEPGQKAMRIPYIKFMVYLESGQNIQYTRLELELDLDRGSEMHDYSRQDFAMKHERAGHK